MTRRSVNELPPDRRHGSEAARVGAIYRRYASSRRRRRAWDARNPGNVAIRDELFNRLLDAAGVQLAGVGRILDIGCGRGYWLRRLISGGIAPGRLHGLDILADRLEGLGLPQEVELRNGDVRALPYADQGFSVVLLFTVLSSLASRADTRVALAEARRVTAAGGVLLIYEPRVPSVLNRSRLWIRARDLREALGTEVEMQTLTPVPPVVRSLGRQAGGLYPYLASIPALRTHRLAAYRRPGS